MVMRWEGDDRMDVHKVGKERTEQENSKKVIKIELKLRKISKQTKITPLP